MQIKLNDEKDTIERKLKKELDESQTELETLNGEFKVKMMKIQLLQLELENKLKDAEEGQEANEAAAAENVKKLNLARAEVSKLKTTVNTLKNEKKDLQSKIKELAAGGNAAAEEMMGEEDMEGEGNEEKEGASRVRDPRVV